jgi:glycine/D-amino acid oxidase-like deaminating enzyme/nitrite reductase/ring-hydroxylating ferredoxin subunit
MYKIWNFHTTVSHPPLSGDLTCDAAVIGGGLTGVLCARALAQRGLSVALFEEHTVAHEGSKTARSTAKATVAHETAASALTENVSGEASRKYIAANLAGLRFLHELTGGEGTCDMYLYGLHGERRLQHEFHALSDGGVVCEYLSGAPFSLSEAHPVTAAVRIPDQLALDPVKLAHRLCAEGTFAVFEHSPVTAAGRHTLTCGGHTVTAAHIIAATNYPVFHEASLPMKLSRKTSYAAAVRCAEGFRLPQNIMAYGADGGFGYRFVRDGEILIVSGETHRGTAAPNAGQRLLRAAAEAANGKIEIVRQWSNNDGYTHDGIPYVGQLRCGIFIACGFGAWGMTNAAGAAVILAEQICGKGVWYDDLFSPYRNFLRGGMTPFAEHAGVAAGGLLRTMAPPPDRYASEVAPGRAEIINYRGRRAGAYRTPDGQLHVVRLRCPHLGCCLEWNPEEKTWDCPCHGSRFDYTGKCISNPAETGIGL